MFRHILLVCLILLNYSTRDDLLHVIIRTYQFSDPFCWEDCLAYIKLLFIKANSCKLKMCRKIRCIEKKRTHDFALLVLNKGLCTCTVSTAVVVFAWYKYNVEDTNTWRYTTISAHAFIAWCFIRRKDNFTFKLFLRYFIPNFGLFK
jgi:hypothetical protein